MAEASRNSDIGEIVRKLERDYTQGNTLISKYVDFNMHDTLERIDAYLNSKHTSGEYDSLGREKPFFNIVIAARNIWYRATDIDRKDIKIRPTKSTDDIEAFLATIHLQEWMRRNAFGQFLNEWGRVLASYGSAVLKFVENSEGLHPMVVPWNRLIVDPVDFNNNVKIEVLELTEAQLRKKKGYDKEMVEALCANLGTRETLDRQRKDNKADYIKLYEVHGELPKSMLTGDEKDCDVYVQQMQVISFTGVKGTRGKDFNDYVLYAGEEEKDPYMITHLIKEDGRTLAIGAVEHLFDAQWMQNHTAKQIKDQLDLASKIIFQTSDGNFVGQNALTAIENGDIMIHALNQPLTRLAGAPDISAMQSFGQQWKQLGNEINGISDAMQGEVKAGAAWRQTEALLQESHSLFELMTENKGLHVEEMLRRYILPHLRKQMDTSEEIAATLEGYNLTKIDTAYIKNYAIKHTNRNIKDLVLKGAVVSPFQQEQMIQDAQSQVEDKLSGWGNSRYISPSDIPDKTWKELFGDMEWDVEVDITGEQRNIQEVMTTLNSTLATVMNPGYATNKKAQFIVNKILERAGDISPMELASIQEPTMAAGPTAGSAAAISPDTTQALPVNQQK